MSHALSAEGRRLIEELARRHGVAVGTAETLLRALVAGGGVMAQFDIAELGGMGQWSRGGMTMVGDMFNNALKARVDALCAELAALLQREPERTPNTVRIRMQSQGQGGGAPGVGVSLFVPGAAGSAGGAWPAELGRPAASGGQNTLRYAYFPEARRLAVAIDGRMTIYDSGDHRITGISQQQAGDRSLTFVSQHGVVRLEDLPVVAGAEPAPAVSASAAATPPPVVASPAAAATSPPDADLAAPPPSPAGVPNPPSSPTADARGQDLLALIETLAALRDKGILTEAEFSAKKTELLSRL